MKSIEQWRGPRDAEVLDPATMIYRATPGSRKQCAGCAFDRQSSAVCRAAAARAAAAGIDDCDNGVIYRLVNQDPRQIPLLDENFNAQIASIS